MRRHTCGTWQCNWSVQLFPYCHNKEDASEVLRLAADLVDWQYENAAPGLKIVGQ